MNELIQNSFNTLTMSSREITALTGKKHYNVKRDIELLAAQLEVDVSEFEHIYTDSQNREQTEYLLDLEICLCLVATYDAKQRMKIIERWQELEQATLPTTQEQFKDIVFSPYQTLYAYPTFEKVVEAAIECKRLVRLLDETHCDSNTCDLLSENIDMFSDYVLATTGMITAKAFTAPKDNVHLQVLYRNQLDALADLTFTFIKVCEDDTGTMYDFHVFTKDVTMALKRLLDNHSGIN